MKPVAGAAHGRGQDSPEAPSKSLLPGPANHGISARLCRIPHAAHGNRASQAGSVCLRWGYPYYRFRPDPGDPPMKLEGIYVPLVTPFDAHGEIDQPKLETLVEAMVGKGVAGLAACGTTGEYYALSDAERTRVLETVHRVAAGRVELIAGIGD